MERALRFFVLAIFVLLSPWARADVGPGPIGNIPGPVLPADTVVSSDGLGYVGGAGSVTAGGRICLVASFVGAGWKGRPLA